MTDPTAPTLEEAIAWLEQQAGLARRLAEQLREYPRAFQPSEGDRIEREAALSALALEAARAGQRLRKLEPDHWLAEMQMSNGDWIDLGFEYLTRGVAELSAVDIGADRPLRVVPVRIVAGIPEPVTPSAEVPGEE